MFFSVPRNDGAGMESVLMSERTGIEQALFHLLRRCGALQPVEFGAKLNHLLSEWQIFDAAAFRAAAHGCESAIRRQVLNQNLKF